MNYSFPTFYAIQFTPFEKKGFELVFRVLQKDSQNYSKPYHPVIEKYK